MSIVVRDNEEFIIFEGDADEFLEINQFDEELADVLNSLDNCIVGTTVEYYGNFYEEFLIEKVEEND